MTVKHHTKLIHEGRYVAEVDVELIYTDTGWAPYLSSMMHISLMTCVMPYDMVM